MYPVGNSRRTIRLDLVRSMRSPVLEMGVASAAEFDELDAAALGACRRDLAGSLHNLAYRLADQGRRDEALAAAEEAVIIRQELTARWPDAHRDKLERSLRLVAGLSTAKPPATHPRGSLRRDNGPLSLRTLSFPTRSAPAPPPPAPPRAAADFRSRDRRI